MALIGRQPALPATEQKCTSPECYADFSIKKNPEHATELFISRDLGVQQLSPEIVAG
jgi:hypothetical protein